MIHDHHVGCDGAHTIIRIIWGQSHPQLDDAKGGSDHKVSKKPDYSTFIDYWEVTRAFEFGQIFGYQTRSFTLQAWFYIWKETVLRIFCTA